MSHRFTLVAFAVLVLLTSAAAQAEEGKKPFQYDLVFGAQAWMKADLAGDAISGEDDFRLGLERVSLWATGAVYEFAELKIHLLSRPSADLALKVADAHLTFKVHPLFNLKVGRFKKPLTSVYTPQWFEWRFFDAPGAFSYLMRDLGLAGRGEGVVAFGGYGGRLLRYSLSVFNGLEEYKARSDFTRSDEGVEVIGRLDWQPLPLFKAGLGFAYLNDTTASRLTAAATDTAPATWSDTKMDLLAYAADVGLFWKGLTVALEYMGHASLPDSGDAVLGGGFYAEALYAIPLPLGELEPGLRFARHYKDFDLTDTYGDAVTGALQWYVDRPHLRVGLEVSWVNTVAAGKATDSVLGLLQVQFVR